jgi:putative NIF3 family GTP cyclohydrolase 1 type 2
MFSSHPYEEVAYELVKLENAHQQVGAGLIGVLPEALGVDDFLQFLKNKMELSFVKFTKTDGKPIKTVAVCGGAGSFLIKKAKREADAYVTADLKYHEFFDAEKTLLLCDIGHFESEKYTIEIFHELLSKKIPNFATIFAQTNTNPVQYR